jgi:riboflavin-specific deaminase-like protein
VLVHPYHRAVKRLHPSPAADVDAYDAYRPADPRAPLVRINMVTSLDGRIVDADGVSGSLGADGDEQAFFAMRAMADAVVAGAGTVRAEGYGPMRVRPVWAGRRAEDGLTGPAPIVVITGSVDLDLSGPLFADAVAPTIVLTHADAPADRVRAVEQAGAIVIAAGERSVDLAAGLQALADDHGLHHLLVEGGPTLNGHLLTAGLVDELCLTLAPSLAGGQDGRRAVDGLADRHDMRLAQVLEADGELLLTYSRTGR